MSAKTKNHVNILNLLRKYEKRYQDNKTFDWRLEQYLNAIFKLLEDEAKNGKLNDELCAVKKKAEFFKGLIEAQSKETILDQYTSISLLSPVIDNDDFDSSFKMKSTKSIYKNEMTKCNKEIRKQLFQTSNESKYKKANSVKNYNDIIKYHELLQEQVTNEMINLTKNLKHNCTISSEIVKKDTELLENTNTFAEKTYSNLKINTSKIKQFADQACEYWLWISLFLVVLTFLFMVVFIRLFPKRNIIYVIHKDKIEL